MSKEEYIKKIIEKLETADANIVRKIYLFIITMIG